jgi:hypothetical protein
MGPSIIERIEQEHKWDGPKLIRRDSEGYLVKEITMEDRMKMLDADNMEFERDELEQEEHERFLQEQQELNPDEYYYDSNSVTSDITDYDDDDDDQAVNNTIINEDTTYIVEDNENDEWVNEE